MHTLIVILSGLALLVVFMAAAHFATGGQGVARAKAAFWFIPVWLVASIANMLVGVYVAGYSFAAEAPIMLVVFGAPAAVAYALRRFALR